MTELDGSAITRTLSPPAAAADHHPLAGPLSADDPLEDGHDDVPASFHSQATVRGMATLRAPKAALARPGYFDLQRLAAQADVADDVATKRRRSTGSRAASVYSVTSSSQHDSDGEEESDETPSWLHNATARRSPLPPRMLPSRTGGETTPPTESPIPPEDVVASSQTVTEALEDELKLARQEAERWKRAYDEEVARHAREMSANAKAHLAREAALLDILTAAGISKARAERALTHATTQSQVPVFLADERAADHLKRTRSPIRRLSSHTNKLPLVSPSHSLSGDDKLPASIMEAMLDEFLGDLPVPPAPFMKTNGSSSHAPSIRSVTPSRSQSPSLSIKSNTQASTSAPSTSFSGNSFFTLNWRRKKPASNASSIRDAGDARGARMQSPELSTSKAGAAAATLNKALQREGRRGREPNVTRLPGLFGPQSKGTIRARKRPAHGEARVPVTATHARELEPMLAHDVRPPTLALAAGGRDRVAAPDTESRDAPVEATSADADEYQSSGDEFEVYGGKHLTPEELAQRVSSTIKRQREAGAEDAMLTDRYGFVYDATPADVRLLRRARKEAIHAPACLTGIRIGVSARGGNDSAGEDGGEDNLLASDSDAEDGAQGPDIDDRDDDTKAKIEASLAQASQTNALPSPALPTTNAPGLLDLTSAKPVVGASHLTAAAASQTSTKAGPTSPEVERLHFLGDATAEPAADERKRLHNASQTVRRLLGQLQDMHLEQQQAQQVAWDAFLARRKAVLTEKSDVTAAAAPPPSSVAFKAIDAVRKGSDALGLSTSPSPRPSAAAEEEWTLGGLIGLGQMGSNNKAHQDLRKLIQGGIPLVYRPKIWYECSGAIEMAEPGRYEELLKEHADEENTCTKQIDLDVGRTMPTNIYFAGDGPGVPKLRRLLVAYSWYNPKCGYCQGMNNLAATLLLTHATEEEAFWVLASIVERILPVDYFTAHLLTAQADQRVVIDFVHEQLPKLARHIDELGVDLPAVTFAWFLSLYTDCLPVETLFRVWDVLFIDGATILFRVALAIFSMNERELLAAQSPSAFYSVMHSMTSHMFSADRLIALASSDEFKASYKVTRIEERRALHTQDLCAELGLEVASLGGGGGGISGDERTPGSSRVYL